MKRMADIIDHTNSLCDASAWIRRLTSPAGFHSCFSDFQIQTPTRGRPAGSKTRFPGLHAFASDMGVSALHAHMVLAGHRESRRLTEAWKRRAS